MAKRLVPQYFDDLDGTQLAEHEVREIRFSFDGNDYLLELSHENADKFTAALEPYIAVAAKESGRGRRRSLRGANNEAKKAYNQSVRDWANNNGYDVAPRGQIKRAVIEAYEEAHKK